MEDNASIIKQVIKEHEDIRNNLNIAGDTINELEAMQSLEKVRRDAVPKQIGVLTDKLTQLQQ